MGAMHMALLGPEGLEKLATRVYSSTCKTLEAVTSIPGVELVNQGGCFFREFAIRLPGQAKDALESMYSDGVIGGVSLGNWWEEMSDCLLVGCDEGTTESDISALANAIGNWIDGGSG
jgi:glycine dehydrogenase subunit 1